MYTLKQLAGRTQIQSDFIALCPANDCQAYAADDVPDTCGTCDAVMKRDNNATPRREILLPRVVKRIQRMYTKPSVAAMLHYAARRDRPGDDGDVWDSVLLRGTTNEQRTNTLYLLICGDGSVFKKGRQVSWLPLSAQILNYPPDVRHRFSAMLLFGVAPDKVVVVVVIVVVVVVVVGVVVVGVVVVVVVAVAVVVVVIVVQLVVVIDKNIHAHRLKFSKVKKI